MGTEFKIGDTVTYFPYEKELPAIVKSISFHNMQGEKDGGVYYTLKHVEGAGYGDRVQAVTAGKCIKEYVLFEKWDGKF